MKEYSEVSNRENNIGTVLKLILSWKKNLKKKTLKKVNRIQLI